MIRRNILAAMGALLAVVSTALLFACNRAKPHRAARTPEPALEPRPTAPSPTPSPGTRSVQDVIEHYGPAARARMQPHFDRAGVQYPPAEAVFLVSKRDRRLDVWAHSGDAFVFVQRYEIKKLSGTRGPKLKEGDGQVPEGKYQIIGLNPNSDYHLSMKLDYPNAFDLANARRESRGEPGSDIFIHGRSVSVGCLAMGDPVIEELFTLVEETGLAHVSVVIAPHDPRVEPLSPTGPLWVKDLYATIETEFAKYRP